MKILVIGPAWVGDMVMTQSMLILLKEQHEQVEIDVLAPEWTLPLLSRMPQVSNSIVMPVGHGKLNLGLRRHLGKSLKEKCYDQAFVLPNSFKSALIPWFAEIPKRTGWRGEARGWLLNDCRSLVKEDYPLMVQRFDALVFPPDKVLPSDLPNPSLLADYTNKKELLKKLNLSSEAPVLALCPGAEYGSSKQWPAEYFSQIANTALENKQQVWVFGSRNDLEISNQIENGITQNLKSDFHNLAGKKGLGDAIDLLSLASAVVSNDSGLMHVAAALNRPLVVIYGSTSPDFTPPLGQKVNIIQSAIECSPCFERECPLLHHGCMRDADPQKIQAALDSFSGLAG